MSIQSEAMLVSLSISKWSGRKVDHSAAEKVITDAGASEGIGSFNKRLIAYRALRPVVTVANQARKYHNYHTTPWDDYGFRLLPVGLHTQYQAKMDGFEEKFEDAKIQVISDYAYYKTVAKKDLGSLYDTNDYPTSDELEEALQFNLIVKPIPDGKHLVIDISAAALQKARDKINKEQSELTVKAVSSLYGRIGDAIRVVTEKIGDDSKVLRQSVIDKLADVVEIVPLMNITQDERLSKMCEDIRELMDGVDAKELRKAESEKKDEVEHALTQMQEQFGGMFRGC